MAKLLLEEVVCDTVQEVNRLADGCVCGHLFCQELRAPFGIADLMPANFSKYKYMFMY